MDVVFTLVAMLHIIALYLSIGAGVESCVIPAVLYSIGNCSGFHVQAEALSLALSCPQDAAFRVRAL